MCFDFGFLFCQIKVYASTHCSLHPSSGGHGKYEAELQEENIFQQYLLYLELSGFERQRSSWFLLVENAAHSKDIQAT